MRTSAAELPIGPDLAPSASVQGRVLDELTPVVGADRGLEGLVIVWIVELVDVSVIADQKPFIRAVADKPRAFVGEQVTVTWYLYLTEPQNNFRPLSQPRTDGFWVEELPSTNPGRSPHRRLALRP